MVCGSAVAGTVFGAFEFALFAASSYFAARHVSGPVVDLEGRKGSRGSGQSVEMETGVAGTEKKAGERKWWGGRTGERF